MDILKKPAQVAFSTAVWTVSFAWMGAVTAVWATSAIFVPTRRTHNYIGGPGMATVLRFTLSDVEVLYHPDFDPERRSVFCQNHVNLLDAHIACKSIPHAFCGLMNAWQFKIPFYGWIMSLAKGIPVPTGKSRFRAIAEAAKDRAGQGYSILAFPEAHRTLDGRVQEFKRGVFMMARGAALPVVPLAVRGMRDLMQKGSLLLKPAKIQVLVGPQIETAGLDDDQLQEVIARTQKIVTDFVERGEVPPSRSQLAAEVA